MKLTVDKIAFIVLTLAAAWYAYPTQAEKAGGALRLSAPVESPNSVHLSWAGGKTGTTYSMYRRVVGAPYWERVAMNLTGPVGAIDIPGFTLDLTYEYKIQADVP